MANQKTKSIGARYKVFSSNWTWKDKILYQLGFDKEADVIYFTGAKMSRVISKEDEYNVGLKKFSRGYYGFMFAGLYDNNERWGGENEQ